MSTTSSTAQPIFNAQERVLCYHGPLIYEAKVLKTKTFDAASPSPTTGVAGPHYLVHYKGWKQTWDEWVPSTRLLKLTEANLATQKSLQQANPGNIHGGSTASKAQNKSAAGGGAGSKDNVSTRAVTRKDGTRGTKRAREEDDSNKKIDMKLNVPEALKSVLVDDWEAVTKNNQLVTLPREPNVVQVLADFAEYVKTTKPPHLKEPTLVIQTVIEGLQIYFDKALGSTLLYRFERVQYANVRREYWTGPKVIVGQEKEMSCIYGAEHLLRMLVSLPQMIAATSLDSESVILIRDYANELMAYMVREKDRLFLKQYQNAALDYQNLSRA
ncbi:Chromatin modification-related protein EAF3 [Psilocybe cubensis]|uniref:Chromatin modification-related protein EAF3 n=2 Tax=Psilocybe cubensis TaxID=181762 RepID=A0ACB8GI25_PSICU|nr:Chromatin modification-related protein EAF3 [Psilocybe cubensis]KAH9475353.1 Chromatin modification-related protein EAF3 [Psilocybe cubensis]